jgi:hypothetical protein
MCFILLVGMIPSVLAQGPTAPCVENPQGCSGQSTPTSAASGSNQQQPTFWSGYNDGRLNPAMDEYYSVWYQHTFVEIWRAQPSSSLISMLPIWLLEGLNEHGGSVRASDFGDDPGVHPLTITRNGDIITVSGNNGNLAPRPGSKSFSLNDCIAHDGHTAAQRGSGGSTQGQSGIVNSTITTCYSPDSPEVKRGLIPQDQICREHGSTSVSPVATP